jgi:hypothetical protein
MDDATYEMHRRSNLEKSPKKGSLEPKGRKRKTKATPMTCEPSLKNGSSPLWRGRSRSDVLRAGDEYRCPLYVSIGAVRVIDCGLTPTIFDSERSALQAVGDPGLTSFGQGTFVALANHKAIRATGRAGYLLHPAPFALGQVHHRNPVVSLAGSLALEGP